MGRLVRVLVAVTSMLTALLAVPSPSLAGAGGSAAVDAAFVDRLLYQTSLTSFVRTATNRIGPDGVAGDSWFDWSTDGCSAPLVGSTGRSFDFTAACRRHDFGYRNTKLLDQRYGRGTSWNRWSRAAIDNQFLVDMKAHCRERAWYDRPTCNAWAATFYRAVRVAGGP